MNAIIIARVSTDEQKEAGNSLPAQVARLEKYCQNKGYKVIRSCSFDESAYTNNRSELDKIIDFVLEQKEKTIVCCDKVDRLSRNIFDKRIPILYNKALNDELELHFVSDGQIITSKISAAEKFQFSINLGLAKYYSDAISDNVRRAFEQKYRKGEWVAKAPYGYKNVVIDGKKDLILDEYAALIVHKVFELYATGAFSLELLCKKVKVDYNLDWKFNYLDKMFNNPFYYGEMRIKNQLYKHRYPPIVTQALFEKVKQIKSGVRKKPYKYAGLPCLYRGLLRCGDCGLAITPERQKGFIYYHCTQYNGKHNAKWLREEAITAKLSAIFKQLEVPKEIVKQVSDTLTEFNQAKAEFNKKQLDVLTKEEQSITKMIDNLYIDKLKGRITDNDYDRFYQRFREQLADITIRLEQLQATDNDFLITTKYLLALVNRAFDLFMSSEVEEKRQIIKLVLSNLTIKGENIEYEAQKPFDLILKCSDHTLWRP